MFLLVKYMENEEDEILDGIERIKNLADGTAQVTYVNGTKYEGDFKNNSITGKGTIYENDGTRSVGSFQNGKFEGNVKIFFNNGDIYDGEFHNNEPHGPGVILNADGTIERRIYNNGILQQFRQIDNSSISNMLSNFINFC